MRREHWVVVILIALVIVGLGVGYEVWGTKASKVDDLQGKVQQLTQENMDLKAKNSATSPSSGPSASPSTTSTTGPGQENKQP